MFSRKQAGSSAGNRQGFESRTGKFLDGIDEEIIIKVQIFSAVFDIITLLEKTGEPGGI